MTRRVWTWLLGRLRAPAPGPGVRTPAFDAVVDLGPAMLAGISGDVARDVAMTKVTAAIRLLPGAGRVRVRIGLGPLAVRVFPAGIGTERAGEAWTMVQARVAEAARSVLPIRVFAPDAGPERLPMAFAEAPGQMEALAALASLAQSFHQEPPRPRPPDVPPQAADVAILARLLSFVLPVEDRVTATVAVRRFGSFAAVLAAPETELRGIPGLGPHSIAAIKLVHEAAVRLARAGVTGQPVLDDPARLDAYLSAALARERVEQFRILFLDARGMLKADELQATGTVNHTPVYPREVVRRALELDAAALVLVHNHPSGDPTPSPDDIRMTQEIRRAAAALGVTLRDHIIVGNGRTLSFRDEGLL